MRQLQTLGIEFAFPEQLKPCERKQQFSISMLNFMAMEFEYVSGNEIPELMNVTTQLLNSYDFNKHYVLHLPTAMGKNNRGLHTITQKYDSVEDFINQINNDDCIYYLYTVQLSPVLYKPNYDWKDAKNVTDNIKAFVTPCIYNPTDFTPYREIKFKIDSENNIIGLLSYQEFLDAAKEVYNNPEKYMVPSTRNILIRYAKVKKD